MTVIRVWVLVSAGMNYVPLWACARACVCGYARARLCFKLFSHATSKKIKIKGSWKLHNFYPSLKQNKRLRCELGMLSRTIRRSISHASFPIVLGYRAYCTFDHRHISTYSTALFPHVPYRTNFAQFGI
jgi:hypothetical protein